MRNLINRKKVNVIDADDTKFDIISAARLRFLKSRSLLSDFRFFRNWWLLNDVLDFWLRIDNTKTSDIKLNLLFTLRKNSQTLNNASWFQFCVEIVETKNNEFVEKIVIEKTLTFKLTVILFFIYKVNNVDIQKNSIEKRLKR